MDDFLYRYRWAIGSVLILVIIAGILSIFYLKNGNNEAKKENEIITELRAQNELLRSQLSEISARQVAGAYDEAADNTEKNDKININTASKQELETLPGIGPARAADIINYRESKGGFRNIEEMKNIKGIGDKTFESMKDLITTGN